MTYFRQFCYGLMGVVIGMVLLFSCARAATITLQPGSCAEVCAAIGDANPPPPPPPPPPPGTVTCSGFPHTVFMDMDWNNPQRLLTRNAGGLGPDDALVVRFTVGQGSSPNNNLSKIGTAEFDSTPSARYAVLSASPCDFSVQAMSGAQDSGYSATIKFAYGGGANFGYYPSLTNGQTYYFNVKTLGGAGCRASGSCDVFVDLLLTH